MRRACLYCGYVYDEAAGCPDSGVAPGTAWDDLPDDWCCPMCSADKTDFEEAGSQPREAATERM
jgi:rubredoxin